MNLKFLAYVTGFIVLFFAIDSIFSRKKYHKDILINIKRHKRILDTGSGPDGVANRTHGAHSVEIEHLKYILTIKNKSNDTIKLSCKREFYEKASLGDSIIYFYYRGYFTNLLWKDSVVGVEINKTNRKKISKKNDSLIEEILNKIENDLKEKIKKQSFK